MTPHSHFNRITFTLVLLVSCLYIFHVDVAEATVRRGKISLNGRYSVRANGCKLSFGLNSTSSVTRIKCKTVGRSNTRIQPGRGRAVLLLKDSIILTGKSCFLKKMVIKNQRIDLLCQSTDPDATPTPTATPTVTPTANINLVFDAGRALAVSDLRNSNTDNPTGSYPNLCGTNGVEGLFGVTGSIVAIDRRPQNGMLYAIGYTTGETTMQLFTISSDKCVATAIGSSGTFVESDGSTPVVIASDAATRFDMDFNPVADRIRVVSSNGRNFRINPNTGAFVDGDLGQGSSVSGLNMDGPTQGNTSSVEGAAYTNNQSNSTVTTLYTLDSFSDKFCRQSPPNTGTQVCSALSIPLDGVIGFDILPGVNVTGSDLGVASGLGYSIVQTSGDSARKLAKIDLVSGAVDSVGVIDNATTPRLKSFAVMQPDGVSLIGLSAAGDALMRFNSKSPTTVTTVATSGVNAGETLVGLDFRPSTGQLFSLGINPTADTGTLYMLDPQTGAATVVGSTGLVAFVDASSNPIDLPDVSVGYGLNFNPVVDRIRVVTGTGLNFRINPVTGAPIDGDTGSAGTQTDPNLNGASSVAHGDAYTNSSAGNTVTTLYTLNGTTDALYLQIPANAGTQAAPIQVMLNGTVLDFSVVNGFNIPADVRVTTSDTSVTSGNAYAALTVGGTTSLYDINLATGAATNMGSIGAGTTTISGLAVANRTAE